MSAPNPAQNPATPISQPLPATVPVPQNQPRPAVPVASAVPPVYPMQNRPATNLQGGPPVAGMPVQSPPKRSRGVLYGFGGIAAVILAAVILYFAIPRSSIVINDQPAGTAIRVKKLVLKKDGFLSVQLVSALKGITQVAGTQYLKKETYENFNLPLDDPRIVLAPDDRMIATLYEDTDGDQGFTFGVDKPMKNIFGFDISVHFSLK